MIVGDFATRALYRITLRAELVASAALAPYDERCDCALAECYVGGGWTPSECRKGHTTQGGTNG